MRTIAFLTQKGGAGKTTLAASLAEVAASTGEKVIALDLDPQQSLVRWVSAAKPQTPAIRLLSSRLNASGCPVFAPYSRALPVPASRSRFSTRPAPMPRPSVRYLRSPT